jgi:hypothetical protein
MARAVEVEVDEEIEERVGKKIVWKSEMGLSL